MNIDTSSVGLIALQIHVRKLKLLKQPKFDLGALLGLHGESSQDDSGQKVPMPLAISLSLRLTMSRLSGSSRRRCSLRCKGHG